MSNVATVRIPAAATRKPESIQTAVVYIADDMQAKVAFEQAVLRHKLTYRTSSISDRPGHKRYEVDYQDPAILITVGYTMCSLY